MLQDGESKERLIKRIRAATIEAGILSKYI